MKKIILFSMLPLLGMQFACLDKFKNQTEKNISISSSISTDKNSYQSGENILVTYESSAEIQENGWIGIIPSTTPHGDENVNDQHDISYQYLKKQKSGTIEFQAPNQNGTFDLRLHDTDNNGKELASVTITITAPVPVTSSGDSSISTDKTSYQPGEIIQVQYQSSSEIQSNGWVGLIPSTTPHGDESVNDQHDVSYQYLQGQKTGSLQFQAPQTPGSFDLRLHNTDNNGQELASTTISVTP